MLGLTGTAAMADVALSGDARMGLTSTNGGSSFDFTSRARVRFTLSAETDAGLKFGAVFRAQEAVDAAAGTAGTVFVEFPDYGRLTMGDADGAVQAAVVQFAPIGYDEAGKRQEFSFLTGGSTGKGVDALYAYTKGNLLVAVSMGNPGAADGAGATQNGDDYGIAASYTTEFWKVAAGYETNGVRDQIVVSGSYGNGQAEVKAAYGARDDNAEQYAVYGTYILGHTTLNAFFRKDFADLDYTGLGVTQDLGGGLSLSAGYATKTGADEIISIGAVMAF
jgi:outer membrane protein OmpU